MSTSDQTLLDRIAALEAENIRLRDALQNGAAVGNQNEDTSSHARLVKKYDDLSKAYRNLQEKHAGYKPYVDRATQKYRAAKEVIKQWQEFYDHQQKKIDRLHEASAQVNRTSSPAPDAPDSERTPRALPKHAHYREGRALAQQTDIEGVSASDRLPHSGDTDAVEQAELPEKLGQRVDQHARVSQAPEVRAQRVTSSQTTQPGSDPAGPYDTRLSSDDEPTFVSARPIKRRRGNSPPARKPATQIKQERTSPSQPLEINSDEFSSPVLARRRPVRAETSNLDAAVDDLDIPTRHRERRAASAEVMPPPRIPTMASSLSEGGGSDSLQRMIKQEGPSTPELSATTALQPEGSDVSDRALQPLSANIARTNHTGVESSKAKRKRGSGGTKAKAAIVSEDGDMDSSQVHAEQPKQTPSAAVSRRLDSLLDEPTPQRHELARRTVPRTRDVQQHRQIETPPTSIGRYSKKFAMGNSSTEPRPKFKMPKMTPVNAPNTAIKATKPLSGRSPPPPYPEDEPLRSRPVIRLNMDDFRINPKYKGTDFAFADSIRGREQRRCLPGCTKPECCGDAFRKAVEMGVRAKKTDNEALEAYLGPNYENHMASRTAEERQDILLKARTYAMASEHGKHRQAFKRRSTPPGFWRIDMPSTQEEEQDRAKAYEMMRQEVYDRWREAMVPGGRWKFRDE